MKTEAGFIAITLTAAFIQASAAAPIEFSCDGKLDGNYRNPNDCGSYIACANGRKYIKPCPKGLHFDWTLPQSGDCGPEPNHCLGQCTYPEEAECGVLDPTARP